MEPFVVPPAWRKFVLPRRADAPPLPGVAAARVRQAAELVATHSGDVLASLANPGTPADLAAAGRAALAGDPAAGPLGAAVVVQVVSGVLQWPRMDELLAFTDHWRAGPGVAFAAAATAELAALYPGPFGPGRPVTRSIPLRDASGYSAVLAVRLACRLRRVVAATSDEEYAAVVAALAAVRGPSLAQRAVISVMAPDETAWADDVIAQALPLPQLEELKSTLLTVVTSETAGLRLARQFSPYMALRNPELIHTFVAGAGPAAVPALLHWLDEEPGADGRRRLLAMLAAVGTDQAIAGLVARLDRDHVPAAVAEAATLHPVRALHALAGAGGPVADRLLRTRLATEPAVADRVRPALTGPAAERFDAALASLRAADHGAATPADLPPVLVSPPWLAPVTRRPLVVAGLPGDEPATLEWAPGEEAAWASSSFAARHGGSHDWEQTAARLGTPAGDRWHEIYFFLQGPAELTGPLIDRWRPRDTSDIGDWGRVLATRYGLAALPALLHCARRVPASAGPLLAPFFAPEIALLMAGWHRRLGSVRAVAVAWLDRHPAPAARSLVPVAAGKAGAARADAEAGLRALAAAGHTAEVHAAAAAHGPEAVAAVAEILARDPLTVLPKNIPAAPDWAAPALLPPVRLTGGRGTLPADAVRHLVTMLAMSRLDDAYPGIEMVRAACEPSDLAGFAWALFGVWRAAGQPAKQGWALDALGLLGDDETVRRLVPVIRAWPGEGGQARAVTGLDVHAGIGTDVALMYLNGIARRLKVRGVKEKAQEKITELAAALGLTADVLADRLVHNLELDAAGSLVLDYGRRSFTVGFDEQLKPFVTDASGKRLTALPKPGVQDDPVLATAAWQRFAALKKDVRAIAADQVRRLERAMVGQRRWTGAAFRQHLADHPLLRHLVCRLVWARFDPSGVPLGGLRPAGDRTFTDVKGGPVTLADGDVVGIAHPLHLGDELAAWAAIFAGSGIRQPFPQLQREVEALTPEQAEQRLGRALLGVTVPTTKLLGLERRGWRRGTPQDAGVQGWLERDVPGELSLVVEIDPGIAVGAPDALPDQKVVEVFVEARAGHRWHRRESTNRLRELDPITAAEALRDLTAVLS